MRIIDTITDDNGGLWTVSIARHLRKYRAESESGRVVWAKDYTDLLNEILSR